MERKTLIEKILDIEYQMFSQVQASSSEPCTGGEQEFYTHRRAQFVPWGTYTLKSYIGDLRAALKTRANPIAQKYICMEASNQTQIANIHIDWIVERNIIWQQEMIDRYPEFMSQGRKLSNQSTAGTDTFFDTYLRCELESYTSRTIGLLHADVAQMYQIGVNMCEMIYKALVQQLGYPSLDAAESALASQP